LLLSACSSDQITRSEDVIIDVVVEGAVSEPNGPVAGASVFLTSVLTVGLLEFSTIYTEVDSAGTDEAGRYRVEAAERLHRPGTQCRFIIEVRAEGYDARTREDGIRLDCSGEPQQVDVILTRP
jgi:hypothetical protein